MYFLFRGLVVRTKILQGVPTTRAASVVTSEDRVVRDLLYTGHPVRERCSVVSRIAPSFLRFGSFEIFKPVDPMTGPPSLAVGAVHPLSGVWTTDQHVHGQGLAQGAGGPRRAWRRSCCRACWTTPSAPTSPTSGARTWATPCRCSQKGRRPPASEPVSDAQ